MFPFTIVIKQNVCFQCTKSVMLARFRDYFVEILLENKNPVDFQVVVVIKVIIQQQIHLLDGIKE